MSTTVLAYVILLMGFITFLGGLFGALTLIFEEVAKNGTRTVQILRDDGRVDIRRPWHDRHWAGPATAAADPWQGSDGALRRSRHWIKTRLYPLERARQLPKQLRPAHARSAH
jgi:hypothetical protein